MVSNTSSLKKGAARLWQRDELPREFSWMAKLSPVHYRLCLVDLHAALGGAHISGDWSEFEQLVDDWAATAVMDANPDFAGRIMGDDREYEDL